MTGSQTVPPTRKAFLVVKINRIIFTDINVNILRNSICIQCDRKLDNFVFGYALLYLSLLFLSFIFPSTRPIVEDNIDN